MQRDTQQISTTLRSVFGMVWRRKWGMLLIIILATGSAAYFSYQKTPIYSATSEVQVTPITGNEFEVDFAYFALDNMDNEVHLVQSAPVAKLADRELGDAAAGGQLSVDVPPNTSVLQITYSHPDPQAAADGAQAFAGAYLGYRTRVASDAYARASEALQRQLSELEDSLEEAETTLDAAAPGSTDEIVAQNEVDQLSIQVAALNAQYLSLLAPDITPGTIIQPAVVPTAPSSPNHRQDIAFGFAVGVVLAWGYAFLRDRLDDRVHGRSDLEAAVQAPTLAVVPKVEVGRRKKKYRDAAQLVTIVAPGSPAAEAYRTLRTNLQFIARDGKVKVIAVTSPHAGEGKTTTVANVAATLAHTGKRVVAVSADLRKPRLHRYFGLGNGDGLSSVLSKQAELSDVVRRPEEIDSLRVLTSGWVPPNPAELLSSDEMEELLGLLRESADYVLVDTAPVLVVSDAMIVARRADAVILIGDSGSTTRASLTSAREQLEQVGANVVGAVLNGFDPSKARYYPYASRYTASYQYRYGYGTEPVAPNGPPSGNGGRALERERNAPDE